MFAADRRLKKPVEIRRPKPSRPARAPRHRRAAVEAARGAVPLAEAMGAFDAAGRVRRTAPSGEVG